MCSTQKSLLIVDCSICSGTGSFRVVSERVGAAQVNSSFIRRHCTHFVVSCSLISPPLVLLSLFRVALFWLHCRFSFADSFSYLPSSSNSHAYLDYPFSKYNLDALLNPHYKHALIGRVDPAAIQSHNDHAYRSCSFCRCQSVFLISVLLCSALSLASYFLSCEFFSGPCLVVHGWFFVCLMLSA